MNRITADTNVFIHAADPDAPKHGAARRYFATLVPESERTEFIVCELALVELYMQLRNPGIFARPYSNKESASYCQALKNTRNGVVSTTTRWCRPNYGNGR
jgi:uncharacterized protein